MTSKLSSESQLILNVLEYVDKNKLGDGFLNDYNTSWNVEDHPELDHEALALLPGEEFDVTFTEAGDYTYWCAPHKGAGMIGHVHVD